MKTTALVLALALAAPLALSAEPLKGSFLLTADSVESPNSHISVSKGHASLVSNSSGAFRVSADEITVDQSKLGQNGRSVITCRGVTSVSAGFAIPASKELTLELDGQANIYRVNRAGIVVAATPTPAGRQFSQSLPKLDLTLRATTAQK